MSGHRDADELAAETRPGGPVSGGGCTSSDKRTREPRTPAGRLLRQARQAKGLSITEAALALLVTRNALYAWESGQTTPGARRLAHLVDVLELDAGELLRALADSPQSGLPAGERS